MVSTSAAGTSSSSRAARQDQSSASSLATLASAASASGGTGAARASSGGAVAIASSAGAVSRGSRASRILHAVTSAGTLLVFFVGKLLMVCGEICGSAYCYLLYFLLSLTSLPHKDVPGPLDQAGPPQAG